MKNLNTNSNTILSDTFSSDYISSNIFEEETEMKKELLKKRLTMIGLGTFYILLFVISFTLLS